MGRESQERSKLQGDVVEVAETRNKSLSLVTSAGVFPWAVKHVSLCVFLPHLVVRTNIWCNVFVSCLLFLCIHVFWCICIIAIRWLLVVFILFAERSPIWLFIYVLSFY